MQNTNMLINSSKTRLIITAFENEDGNSVLKQIDTSVIAIKTEKGGITDK